MAAPPREEPDDAPAPPRVRRFVPGRPGHDVAPEQWGGTDADEDRVERALRLARRLEGRGRETTARAVLASLLARRPNHPRALDPWIALGRRLAPPGAECPGLRELAGRPGAWRARACLAVELVQREDPGLTLSWLDSALEAAAPDQRGEVWDLVLGRLARRGLWEAVARCAEPLLEEPAPPRAALFAVEAWLRVGDEDSARRLADTLPRELVDRQPFASRLRPRPAALAPAREARVADPGTLVVGAPLWAPARAPQLVVLVPAVPRERAERAPEALLEALDLAHGLAALDGRPTGLLVRRDGRGRLLAPLREVASPAALEQLLATGGLAAPLVVSGRWVPRRLGGHRLVLHLWDLEARRLHRVRARHVQQAVLRLAAILRRRRAPGERTRRPRIPRGVQVARLAEQGLQQRLRGPRREALAELLAEVAGRGEAREEQRDPAARPGWERWWEAAPEALEPRLLASELARLRLPREGRTRARVVLGLSRGRGARGDGRREGELVSRLRGL